MKIKFKYDNNPLYLKVLLFLIPIVALLFNFKFDNDFWFTINQGRYILNNGFPNTVISTIHEGLNFVYQSYGTGIIFYLVYKYFGSIGMMILLILLAETISYFFYKLCYTISNNKNVSCLLSIIFMTLFSTISYLVTRPLIFTILNLTIILYLLEKYLKENKPKYLIPIPIIGLIQANIHGVYLLPLLIILCPYIINSFKFKIFNVESKGYNKKHLFITYILTFIVGFINPYTYKTIFYGLKSYTPLMKSFIKELASPTIHNNTGIIIFGLFFLCFFVYYVKKQKMPLRYYLLILGTTYMTLDAIKSMPFFILCGLFPIAFLFRKDKPINDNSTKKQKLIACSIIILVIVLSSFSVNINKKLEIEDLVKYLDLNNKIDNPKLYTNFWDGSYVEYRGYNCYIDPRAEVFLKVNNKKEDILKEYILLQQSKSINYNEFLKKYDFDYLVISKEKDSLYYYLLYYPNDLYEIIYEDQIYQLWQKKTTS
ncbi:MAG: hypothetical protein J6X02_01480 [Bacilli bacterium]|nr:hypothetical protein [Bacilli bacterium]